MRRRTISRLSTAAVAAAAVMASVLIAPPAYAAPVTHTIAAVQGSAAASPLAGQVVTVEGVVTGDHRSGGSCTVPPPADSRDVGYCGIYVQTAGSGGATDATPGRSDGIFVFLSSNPAAGVAIGDLVTVTGTVSESNTVTQIDGSATGAVERVGSGALPQPVSLPATVLGSAREAFEGMLVQPTGTYKLVSSHNLQTFGELWMSAGSAMPVEAFESGAPNSKTANDIIAANNSARLILDDGYKVRTDRAAHPGEQPYFTKDVVVRNGDTVEWPTGVSYLLSFDLGNWRLQPTTPLSDTNTTSPKPSFTPVNLRPEEAPDVGGDITVAAFNVLNYFTTLRSQNPDARGAFNPAEFAIQKSKIVTAINGLDADIVALQEIENSVKLGEKPDEALADLVAGLNDAAGKGTWDYVRTPRALHDPAITDVITNAIIYKPAVVMPSGRSKTVIDENVWDNAREPIAQTFKYGKQFVTVVSNHFKSKNPTDPRQQPGQDPFNLDRVDQANSLLTFANSLSQGRKNAVYLVGDFNAYAQEDPIKVFVNAGWTDLLPAVAPGQYTYTFDGELGSLDHVIASPAAADKVTQAAVWTINAPEWSGREYWGPAAETGTPFRSSDHDPILVGVGSEGVPGRIVDIDLVTVNDFHGRIEQAAPAGGIAALSSAVKQIRAANPNTIFAAAGDMIGASTFTSFIQQDKPTIDALNAAGLDVSAVGNHEFDQGFADLTDRAMPLALWEYLGANVIDNATGKAALPEYYTQTFQGVTVGFIGAVTDELPSLVSPDGIAGLTIEDPAVAVNRVAGTLSDGNKANGEADIIVLLIHEGATTTDESSITDPGTRFGRIVLGVQDSVDAIVSGHTHLAYNHVLDNGVPVISSGQYGERFSHMDIQYDRSSKTFTMKNQIFNMMNGAGAIYADDPAVAPIVAEAVKVAADLGGRVLGTTTAGLGRAVASAPVPGASLPENRGGESTLGNFVADVQKWALSQNTSRPVDITFMNPGGLRADIAAGEVTYRQAADVQPFANTLVKLDLTPAQIKQVLEEQWQPAGASRPFLKLGVSKELTYTYDPGAARFSHITEIRLNGELLDPAATYTVGVNSFLAAGGDNFSELAKGTNRADSGQVDLEAMVDYFAADPDNTVSPDLAQRAVGVRVSPPDADGYGVGDIVTVNLSSLEFTRGETAAGTVVISLGGAELDSDAVLGGYTPTTDEVGTATLQFPIPAGATGPTRFLITVPTTGTVSSFTINVG